jgi:tRNA-Thr(GGU) m(6)t(6)A37 methyltransferase TsaA
MELTPIGRVESSLTNAGLAPKQGDEGAPDAWLVFEPGVLGGLDGLRPGARVIVLTWLDRARRDVLRVHPRDDPANPVQGVFNTRSADRPNPIGLHPVEIVSIEGERVRVRNLEALDATPIVDVKPVVDRRLPGIPANDEHDRAGFARAVVDANRYMTLATADADGLPWASPVWYAPSGHRELFWVSDPQARHSRNVAARPEVSIVIFDSRAPIGTGQGVYIAAVAEQVTGADLDRGIAVFSQRSQAQGGAAWTRADVLAPARLRLYRATASEHYVGGRDDRRTRVDL